MAVVHGVLEQLLSGLDQPMISSVWRKDMIKLPLLERDLAFFRPRIQAEFPRVVEEAVKITECMHGGAWKIQVHYWGTFMYWRGQPWAL